MRREEIGRLLVWVNRVYVCWEIFRDGIDNIFEIF